MSIAILLMGYGGPPSLDEADVRAYLKHVLNSYGAPDPTPDMVAESIRRQSATGGTTVQAVSERLTIAVQHALDLAFPERFRVYGAFKHTEPFIDEQVRQIAADGADAAVAVTRAPFASRMTTQSYFRRVDEANAALSDPLSWTFAEPFWNEPLFVRLWAERVRRTLPAFTEEPLVVFTNHSLPERIRQWDDPYEMQFEATAGAVARDVHLEHRIAYTGGRPGGQWLGPEVREVVRKEAAAGRKAFLLAPIGFTVENIEIRWDLDVEVAQELGDELNVEIRRAPMDGDDPTFVALIVEVISDALRRSAARRQQ